MSAVIPRSFFVGAKRALLPEIPQVFGAAAPHIATDAESWLASLPSDEQARVSPLLRNAVKKCGQCAKPNAFTLKTCNSCGQSIEATPTTFTTNVFTCFVLGIAKGPFPLSISIRRQTKDVIVLDDLLALSPLHLNAIPASQYMPDWRYLLTRPAEGLPLLRSLLEECHTAAEEHFLSRPEWCAAAIKGGVLPREAFMAGFNYPPSQYQLHVQFIAPMLLPFQRYQYERGTHYTFGRFFPVAYAERCLEALLAANERLSADWLNKDIEALVDHLKTKYGVDYEAMHRAAYTKTGSDYHTYANWSADQFHGTATEQPDGALVFTPNDSSVDATALDVTAQVNKDKTELQNYGRPYDANGKPTGSFYSFPKRVDELMVWSA